MMQPDEIAMAAAARMALHSVPFDVAVARLRARNLPPPLVQSPFVATLTAIQKPVLLIPRNKNRKSFFIANPNAASIGWSYGYPAGVFLRVTPQPLGAWVGSNGFFSEQNGSVSIDDVWVWADESFATFPAPVLGYEGRPALQ